MATSCTSEPVSAAGFAGLLALLGFASFAALVSAVFLPLGLRCSFCLSDDPAPTDVREWRSLLSNPRWTDVGWASRQCAPAGSFCRLPLDPAAGAFGFRFKGRFVSSMLF